jgi:hypothetical protein
MKKYGRMAAGSGGKCGARMLTAPGSQRIRRGLSGGVLVAREVKDEAVWTEREGRRPGNPRETVYLSTV